MSPKPISPTPSRKFPCLSGTRLGAFLSGVAAAAMLAGATATAVAGDLLRGGYTVSSSSGAAAPGSFTSPSVTRARKNAQDELARTTQTVHAMQAMQGAASKLAAAGRNNLGLDPNHPGQMLLNVPNGLNSGGAGGLIPDSGLASPGVANPVTTWSGAGTPKQSIGSKGRINVTVVQTAPDAILNWQTFNIGKATTLVINQSKGGQDVNTWIAFNIVRDPSGVPSQILGSIVAPGQVYVINQNGIIFGGSSQINVHGLVASSLPIDTYLINHGLLNNPDEQFLFSAIAQPSGAHGSPQFTPPPSFVPGGADGNVTVQPGAVLSSPASVDNVGGRVALIGPNVENEGWISTPDGQTILAAGLQVGLAAHSSGDASLRGLDVYIGKISDPAYPATATAGVATNDGFIYAPRADTTIAGAVVDQLGVIDSTTSVTLNGRIDLLANYDAVSSKGVPNVNPFLPQATGEVVMGGDSVTQILPEWGSTERVVGTSLALSSIVDVRGLAVHMAPGAQLFAPSAQVAMDAGVWDYQMQGSTPVDAFIHTSGQIYLDTGSQIDVQGSWDVSAPVSENIISAQLLGPELADSPSQRSGPFVGQTIQVDIRDAGIYNGMVWVGTPLADTSGYVGLIERTVGELTTAGGTVNLDAGSSVVMKAGSEVNVSGGWIDYQGGVVQTSEVISNGHVYPISEATPDMVYSGFNLGTFTVNHPTYGVTATYTDPLLNVSHYEDSYIQGFNGGQVSITAPATALDGQFFGNTVAGPRQRQVLPDPSQFNLSFLAQRDMPTTYPTYSPTPPSVVFDPTDYLPAASPFALDSSGNPLPLSTTREKTVILSPDLVGSDGFGDLNINNGDGNITVPSGVTLRTEAEGSITLVGANIDLAGSIFAPGGTLNFTAYDFTPYSLVDSLTATPPPDPKRGHFILGSGATLSTAGLLVDDRRGAPDAGVDTLVTRGGSISIKSYSADLSAGSVIDVSGGVEMTQSGKPAYGNGGSISVAAGQDPAISSLLGGSLILDSGLEGFSGAQGGSLSILAPLVQVGGVATHADTLLLSADFFSQGGFASFSLTGLGEATNNPDNFVPAVYIAPGTVITPVVSSLVARAELGGDVQLVPAVLPVGVRPPVNLSFKAAGVTNALNSTNSFDIRGDLVMGEGSVIRTDPGGSVTEIGNTVAVLGSIFAPAGNIIISGGQNSLGLFPGSTSPVVTVDLGPHSVLSAAGTTVLTANNQGYRTGSVLGGGSISVSGNIVAEAGAVLDVSGASNILDLSPVQANVNATLGGAANAVQEGSFLGKILLPTRVDSNGGSISLSGGQELFTDATLRGAAGGPSALGGTLSLSSGLDIANQTALDVTLLVTQGGSTIPAAFYPAGQDAVGHTVVDRHGKAIAPMGYFAVSSFASGGFDSLNLQGTVQFSGPVNINAKGSLRVATGGVIFADAPVNLSANYVALGLNFLAPIQPQFQVPPFFQEDVPFHFAPTYGAGSLTVTANLIDIGTLSLQGIGAASFVAKGGSIRGDGTLDVAGRIVMEAGQVYVPTDVAFTIAAYDYMANGSDHAGSVTFLRSGTPEIPLSAGGVLSVYASNINQDGVLLAPLGFINLGWDGSGTAPVDAITGAAVDVTKELTLGPGSITSVSAVDPLTGQAEVIPYGSDLNGTSWIDPAGIDITAGGVPQKAISISAVNVNDERGSLVDIQGGGDLMAYRFISGIKGTEDLVGSPTSFAILPGYNVPYAPYDTGFSNGAVLTPGNEIYLKGSSVLAAGDYTLLPASYALIPGGILVTPLSSAPTGMSEVLPDGGSLVTGYRFNTAQSAAPVSTSFELDPAAVIAQRAQYEVIFGNVFLSHGATVNNQPVPRLPRDSGRLSFQSVNSLAIAGSVSSTPVGQGLGGLVDIASPENIVIAGPGVTQAGALVLNAGELSSFGAASLLIGGTRQTAPGVTTITVTSDQITVDNAGSPLTGQDIILAANDNLTFDAGAELESSGGASPAGEVLVNGNGVLVRVSSDSSATVERTGVTTASAPLLDIGKGVKISGASVTLDSSSATDLDPLASITGRAINLDSGQVTVELSNPGSVAATTGLVLTSGALQTIEAGARSLSLLSYSSIDFYGTGQFGALNAQGQPTLNGLALHAGEIRGFNTGGGNVTLAARTILLDNRSGGTGPGPVAAPAGSLVMDAASIEFGANAMEIDQFATVDLNSSGGMIAESRAGSISVQGDLNLTAPLITGIQGANETLEAGGALTIATPANPSNPTVTAGLGATLAFIGASVTDNGDITLPSGSITLHATSGDVNIGNLASATLHAGGEAKTFFDVTKYTSGGQIDLIADRGNVVAASGANISVAAQSGGGNAGALIISDPNGTVALGGQLAGQGGAGGQSGIFSLDAGSLPALAALDANLNAAGFDQSRTIRVRTGDVLVDGLATAANFDLSADAGSITVSGEINGSGATGGSISLQAEGSVTLLPTAWLTVAAQNFNDAGRGGSLNLEAGSDVNGAASSTAIVDIQTGSVINLSVAAAAAPGDLAGTLRIRAPQAASNTDLQVNPINGTITGASSITVEGYAIYNTAGDNGSIDDQEGNVFANGQTFAGNSAAISSRLLANNAGLASILTVEPGAEIINPSGDLTLSNTWDLAPYRFGPNNVPGDLTLRAAGNLVFESGASLSDGFNASGAPDQQLWDAPLLPVGEQSWSYRLVAGADFTGANHQGLTPLANLAAGSGSVLLGLGSSPLFQVNHPSRSSILSADFETIRTGAGSIAIYAGRDVQLLNSLATIYSAGTQAPALAGFTLPNVSYRNSVLGTAQKPFYPVEYSEDGGSVTIVAQNDIAHYIQNSGGGLSPDSSLELPDNWLYRQGSINPATGSFISATSWWSDFSNFVEGVAAFGGGNVTLNAGHDISNVDAAIPTNARMPNGAPNAAGLLELGGGDLMVNAGGDISGGVYYVERGLGTINAGGQILTNSTRATLSESTITFDQFHGITPNPATWLPTTFFAGAASFDISAGGDILLGAVANPFLLPQGINNSYLNREYFSTYAASDTVNVQSLAGTVTVKDSADGNGTGTLESWLANIDSPAADSSSFAATSEPWLRTIELNASVFSTVTQIMPPTLHVTAFSGSIDLVGSLVLSPAPNGTVDLLAADSINALQPNGFDIFTGLIAWGTGVIDLSDANPASMPGITTPIALAQQAPLPAANPFLQLNALFNETGSTEGAAGSIQAKESLHDPGLLHANDPTPVHLYADTGDISGLTLYTGKFARVAASQDITDTSLYIQNVSESEISVVSAGRDIMPYDPNSPLRLEALAPGNELIDTQSVTAAVPGTGTPTAGDFQISGAGALEVLAGRNLTLGSGPNNPDGTAVGITSIGNGRDPYLPFAGAQVVVAAGLGQVAIGLGDSSLDIAGFASQVLEGAGGATYFTDLQMTDPGLNVSSLAQFQALDASQKAIAALDLFYLVLRDAGRNHNLAGSTGFGNYDAGIAAIAALLPAGHSYFGDIDLTSKEIKTESGGDIDILAPGGHLTVGIDLAGSQPVDQGILTDDGGNISIYTKGDVDIGTSRIFTLRGGNEIIWSNEGNIAAGESAKTVQSAPPTRVLIDPQSADVETDLAGLATGGGIGVLASVAGVAPGSVDLIAPVGVINAGDAGIRATGNLNLAAVQILNASNIQAGGATTGVPTVTVVAPNLAGLASASAAVGATAAAASDQANSAHQAESADQGDDSIISVDVIGYGGSGG